MKQILLIITSLMLVLGCEDTQTESSDSIDSGVVINEINYNSSDSYDPDDWVEFYNSSSNSLVNNSFIIIR